MSTSQVKTAAEFKEGLLKGDTSLTKPITEVAISILGPNLSATGKGLGQFHIHAARCGDIKKNYGPGKKMSGENIGWIIKVKSRKEIVENIYGDDMDDNGDVGPNSWKAYDDLYIYPCVSLPNE